MKIEGTIPTGSPWYTTDVKVSFASVGDSGGSTIRKYGIGSSSGSKTVVHQEEKPAGVTYTGHIDDKAGNTNTCSITFKKKAKHTITFDKNGGVGTANSIIATYGSAYGTLPVIARAGYGFQGWYTAKEGGVRVTASTIFYGYDAQTLYAHWSTCTAGTYSTDTISNCTACPSGYTSGNGASGVGSCYMSVPAGNYVSFANAWYYNSCNAGTYRGAHTVYYGNTSSCYPCWAGTYSNAGAGSCSSCPSGYTSGAGATSISSCYISVSAGRHLPTAKTTTTNECGVGSYSGAHTVYYGGTSACTSCGENMTTSGTGSTSSSACYISCPAGQYVSGNSCVPCGVGTYGGGGTSTSCTSCGTNKTTSGTGNTSSSACYTTCPAGQYVSGNSCVPCGVGTYGGGGTSTSCTSCGANMTTSGTGSTSSSACYASCTRKESCGCNNNYSWINSATKSGVSLPCSTVFPYYVNDNTRYKYSSTSGGGSTGCKYTVKVQVRVCNEYKCC